MKSATHQVREFLASRSTERGPVNPHIDGLIASSELSDKVVAPAIVQVEGKAAEIAMSGEIGWEVTALGVMDALDQVGDGDVTVRINSGGGNAFEGFAIYNMLARHPGKVSVVVESVAASAASFIAMAGADVTMAPAAFIMIHNSMAGTMGNRQAHEATIAVLEKIDATMAGIYAAKTGKPVADIAAMLAAETWMTSDEAVAEGFADRVEELATPAALAPSARMTDVIRAFTRTPDAVLAMAQPKPDVETHNGDTQPVVPEQPQPAEVPQQETTSMHADIKFIQAIAARAGLNSDWVVEQLVAKRTEDQVRDAAIDAKASVQHPTIVTRSAVARDGAVATSLRMLRAAVVTAGGRKSSDPQVMEDAKLVEGMTFRDLAADWYEATTGERPRLSPDALLRKVFAMTPGMHTTGDFPTTIGDAIEVIVRETVVSQSRPWRDLVKVVSFTNLKSRPIVGNYSMPMMEEILEHEEVRYGTIARIAGSIKPNSFAKGFAFTRQAMLNNDLEDFTGESIAIAQMAADSLSDRVWSVFRNGTSTAPRFLMPDGLPWINAAHGNLAASGTAITEASMIAAFTALGAQVGSDGKPLGLVAAKLIVGNARLYEARKLLTGPTMPDNSVNLFNGAVELVFDPAFGNGWMLVADPNRHPVVAVALLNGNEVPYVDTFRVEDVYGLKVRVGLDYEAAPFDYTGVYYNPGP